MQIAPHRVISLHYRLLDADGTVLDDSRARDTPLEYLHGHVNIVPGLEQALAGHAAGDSLTVTLGPDEAYGQRDEAKVQKVGRGSFPVADLATGMRFQTPGEDGPQVVTVLEVGATQVTVDTNHPLAGETLTYELQVLSVRDATRAELAKGHPLPEGTDHTKVEDRKVL